MDSHGYVLLHLENGKRLLCFVLHWPPTPDEGHFDVSEAAWVSGDGSETQLRARDILIPAKDVRWIEFYKVEEIKGE
ncbi:MAG: hypothetical protein DHS20C11_01060 [Lysobacteraceae bacterium]|nr:MAG: hypothetical protein DHS20C11_01060 [Xanthomonadaceae bacterium]